MGQSVQTDKEPSEVLEFVRSGDLNNLGYTMIDTPPPDTPKLAQLGFNLEYTSQQSELVVSVIQAKDLEDNEVTRSLDSYVKVWLNPHKQGKLQTQSEYNTINPQYKERFLFTVYPDELNNKIVQFQVFSSDKYSRHKLLGETELKLGDIDLRQPTRVWMNLRDMDQKPTNLGSILFSLSYLPTAERLTIVLVKARNLSWSLPGAKEGDCFVKVYLLQNGKKMARKKTALRRAEAIPLFNQAMTFSVPVSDLQSIQLLACVIEQRAYNEISPLGHVTVGCDLHGSEVRHWNEMITSLRQPVVMWHSLCK